MQIFAAFCRLYVTHGPVPKHPLVRRQLPAHAVPRGTGDEGRQKHP